MQKEMRDWWQQTFPKGRQQLQIEDANGERVSIAYGEKGDGQPLLLVHGVASWSYAWHRNIDALAQHFRVICFDAKGCGFSEKTTRPDPVHHKLVEMERIVRQLCQEPAVIVAESLGALVALGMLQQNPALCDRLVLINVPIFMRQLPSWLMQVMAEVPLELVRVVDQARVAKLVAPLLRQGIYALREEVVADPTHVTPEDVYWSIYPQIEFPNTITKLAEELQRSAAEIRLLEQGKPNLIQTVQDNLPNVTCPTLILWSEHDRWFPISHAERLRDRLPKAQLKIIPNCGHYAAGAQPEFVNQAILDFLERVSAGSDGSVSRKFHNF